MLNSNMDISIYFARHLTLSLSLLYIHRHTGMKSAYVTGRFAIQSKTVRLLIMSEDFWDTLKLITLVLKPALVALRYDDGMKEGTVALL